MTEHFGDAIFSGLDVPRPKPAPDVYLVAAKAFNVSPNRCVVIEDSVPGVTAGVCADMKVYGYAAFTPSKSLSEAGAIPFKNMEELQTILSRTEEIITIQTGDTKMDYINSMVNVANFNDFILIHNQHTLFITIIYGKVN